MSAQRHKIGTPFRAALLFEIGEALPINLRLRTEAAIRQGSVQVFGEIGELDPNTRLLPITVETGSLKPGLAAFDVWIDDVAVPGQSNVELDLFKGAAYREVPA